MGERWGRVWYRLTYEQMIPQHWSSLCVLGGGVVLLDTLWIRVRKDHRTTLLELERLVRWVLQ